MAKPGRKPHAIPRIRWDVYVRTDLAAEVELLLADPMRQRAKYGARTELLESLIQQHLARIRRDQRGAIAAPEPSDLERMINELKFEIQHWNLSTLEKLKQIINKYDKEATHG